MRMESTMTSPRVTLKTSSGWQHTTTLDDPIFADVLAPYNELGMEKEMLLTGSVAEVIEKHWSWWKSVKAAFKDRAFSGYPTVAFVPSLEHFTKVLNLPDYWRLYVTASRSDLPLEAIIQHYSEIGKALADFEIGSSNDEATRSVLEYMEAQIDKPHSQVLRGMEWVATLRSEDRWRTCRLVEMDWTSFREYLSTNPIRDDAVLLNTIKLLQGCGNLTKSCLFNSILADVGDPCYRHLYSALMSNDLSRVDMDDIGFSALVGGNQYGEAWPAMLCISQVHEQACQLDPDNRLEDLVNAARSLLSHAEIRDNARKICKFLREQVEIHNVPKTKRRIAVFLAFIEEELGDD